MVNEQLIPNDINPNQRYATLYLGSDFRATCVPSFCPSCVLLYPGSQGDQKTNHQSQTVKVIDAITLYIIKVVYHITEFIFQEIFPKINDM